MNFLTKAEDLTGKTISRAVELASWRDRLALLFTDGTIAVIDNDVGHDGESSVEFSTELSERDKLDLGLLSREAYDQQMKENFENNEKRKKLEKWEQFQKLKKEFEGPDCVFKETT